MLRFIFLIMLFCASCAETPPTTKSGKTTKSEKKSTTSKSSIVSDSSKSFNTKLEEFSSAKPNENKSQVFKYKKLGSTTEEFIQVERKKIVNDKGNYLVAISSSGNTKLDSTVFNYDDLEVQKTYMFDSDNKAYEIEFGLTEKTPNQASANFVNEKMNFRMEILYNITNDTSYTWKGTEVPAIYVTERNKVESKESNKILRSYPGYSIYAKDVGRIRYGTNINGDLSEWELVSMD